MIFYLYQNQSQIYLKISIKRILFLKKLPYKKIEHSYDLEYGSATIEVHTDAITEGDKVLIHDDLLATGGSASAAAVLVQKCGGTVAGFNFLVGLSFLNGDSILQPFSENIVKLVEY